MEGADRLCYSEFRPVDRVGSGRLLSRRIGTLCFATSDSATTAVRPSCASRESAASLAIFSYLIIGLRESAAGPAAAQRQRGRNRRRLVGAHACRRCPSGDLLSPWFIILNSPDDLAAFWKSIERPDLVVIKADQLPLSGPRSGSESKRAAALPWVVESVQVRGQINEDFANLKVELLIVVKGPAIRLGPHPAGSCKARSARAKAALELGLRRADSGAMASLARARRRAPDPGRVEGPAGRRAGSQVAFAGHPRSGLDRRGPRVFAGRVRHRRGSQRGLRADMIRGPARRPV